MNLSRVKLFIIFLILVGGLVAVIALHSWYFSSTILISGPPSAQVFVKQGGQSFKEIGKGTASYKTKSEDTVFIEVRSGESTTQKSQKPVRRKTESVRLALKDTVEATRIGPGPMTHFHTENGFVYGINPNTNSLDVKSMSGSRSVPTLPLLPFLKQVFWVNSSNFIYVSSSKGTGVISSDAARNVANLPYYAASKSSTGKIALLGSNGLYVANGLDLKSAKKIAEAKSNVSSFLFSDDGSIYYGWLEFSEHEETDEISWFGNRGEAESHEEDPTIQDVKLNIYTHEGSSLHELTLPIQSQVLKVLSTGDNVVAVLAGDGLRVVDLKTKETRLVEFSLGEVRDMVLVDKKIVVLGSSGLWELDTGKGEASKVSYFPGNEEYVPSSLTLSGEDLYFSSRSSSSDLVSGSSTQSSILKVVLP